LSLSTKPVKYSEQNAISGVRLIAELMLRFWSIHEARYSTGTKTRVSKTNTIQKGPLAEA